jgi:hypothetical protein
MRIALAEAKGSYGAIVSSPQSAHPLRKAKEQLETAQVWLRDSLIWVHVDAIS